MADIGAGEYVCLVGLASSASVLALAIRRLPYALRASYAALQQISVSLEESAQNLGATKVRTVRRIVVQPYLHDPNAQRFTRYTAKRYTFDIADSLPGQVAQIRSEVPGPDGDFGHPVRTETLTFRAAVRKLTGPASAPAAKPAAVPSASR